MRMEPSGIGIRRWEGMIRGNEHRLQELISEYDCAWCNRKPAETAHTYVNGTEAKVVLVCHECLMKDLNIRHFDGEFNGHLAEVDQEFEQWDDNIARGEGKKLEKPQRDEIPITLERPLIDYDSNPPKDTFVKKLGGTCESCVHFAEGYCFFHQAKVKKEWCEYFERKKVAFLVHPPEEKFKQTIGDHTRQNWAMISSDPKENFKIGHPDRQIVANAWKEPESAIYSSEPKSRGKTIKNPWGRPKKKLKTVRM